MAVVFSFGGIATVPTRSVEVTGLLKAWSGGDQAALERLADQLYNELRRIARRFMRNERAGNTLQTTALVNEVYLRLVDIKNVDWQQRAQFFAIAAQMMRRILVDAARARGSHKRGGGAIKVNVDEAPVVSPERDSSLVALDEALETFERAAPDVLLSDIGMPVQDGYALIHQIRARAASRGGLTPAVAPTAYASPTDRLSTLAAGYQAHVAKPFEPEDVATLVRRLARRETRTN